MLSAHRRASKTVVLEDGFVSPKEKLNLTKEEASHAQWNPMSSDMGVMSWNTGLTPSVDFERNESVDVWAYPARNIPTKT